MVIYQDKNHVKSLIYNELGYVLKNWYHSCFILIILVRSKEIYMNLVLKTLGVTIITVLIVICCFGYFFL